MYFQTLINASTRDYSAELQKLKTALDSADAVVIGAGAGLSTAAGYTYSGERFEKYFPHFKEKYGFEDTESADKEVLPQNSIFSHNKCVKINT